MKNKHIAYYVIIFTILSLVAPLLFVSCKAETQVLFNDIAFAGVWPSKDGTVQGVPNADGSYKDYSLYRDPYYSSRYQDNSIIAIYTDGSKTNVSDEVTIMVDGDVKSYDDITFERKPRSEKDKDERTVSVSYRGKTITKKVRVLDSYEVYNFSLKNDYITPPTIGSSLTIFDTISYYTLSGSTQSKSEVDSTETTNSDNWQLKTESVYVKTDGKTLNKGNFYHVRNGQETLLSTTSAEENWYYQLLIDLYNNKYTNGVDYFAYKLPESNNYALKLAVNDIKPIQKPAPLATVTSISFASTTWPNSNNVALSGKVYTLNTTSTTDTNSIIAKFSDGTVRNITKDAVIKEGSNTLKYNSLSFTRKSYSTYNEDERTLTITYKDKTLTHKIRVLDVNEIYTKTFPTYPTTVPTTGTTFKIFNSISYCTSSGSITSDSSGIYVNTDGKTLNKGYFYHHKGSTATLISGSSANKHWFYQLLIDIYDGKYTDANDYFTFRLTAGSNVMLKIKPSELKARTPSKPAAITTV